MKKGENYKMVSLRLVPGTLDQLRLLYSGMTASQIVRLILRQHITDRRHELEERARIEKQSILTETAVARPDLG